jgi:hypothetical protein
MSHPRSHPRAARRLHTALDRGLVTLGALVAVGVMVLFLTLVGADRANPASSMTATHPSTAHVTRIQPRATAASPTRVRHAGSEARESP